MVLIIRGIIGFLLLNIIDKVYERWLFIEVDDPLLSLLYRVRQDAVNNLSKLMRLVGFLVERGVREFTLEVVVLLKVLISLYLLRHEHLI